MMGNENVRLIPNSPDGVKGKSFIIRRIPTVYLPGRVVGLRI